MRINAHLELREWECISKYFPNPHVEIISQMEALSYAVNVGNLKQH